jgi:hypothetical protein
LESRKKNIFTLWIKAGVTVSLKAEEKGGNGSREQEWAWFQTGEHGNDVEATVGWNLRTASGLYQVQKLKQVERGEQEDEKEDGDNGPIPQGKTRVHCSWPPKRFARGPEVCRV